MFDSSWKDEVTLSIVYHISNISLFFSNIIVEYLVGIELSLKNNCVWYIIDKQYPITVLVKVVDLPVSISSVGDLWVNIVEWFVDVELFGNTQ